VSRCVDLPTTIFGSSSFGNTVGISKIKLSVDNDPSIFAAGFAAGHNHTESCSALRLLGKILFIILRTESHYHLLNKHRILIIRRDSLVSQSIRTKKQEPRGCNEIETQYRAINDFAKLCTFVSSINDDLLEI